MTGTTRRATGSDRLASPDLGADGRGQPVLVVTGMSGAGKTTALKCLEDLGYECVDHVPLHLLRRLARPSEGEIDVVPRALAAGIDVRTRDFSVDACLKAVAQMRGEHGIDSKLVFLHCEEEELRRRYSVSRHRHPLADGEPLTAAISREREMLGPLLDIADLAIDTTHISPGELKRILEGHFAIASPQGLTVAVVSFSFRGGLPRDADLVFDVRFLANPHYIGELRPLTGCDPAVGAFITQDPAYADFFATLTRLLKPLLPRYVMEGKSYLTIAVGCTGGRHRSVFVAERLAAWLREADERVAVHHRELGRSGR
jgi:UPF0042 nucleotide-binding protein